jgi:deoxyribodipyrimidine photo-lyase
MKPEVGVVWFKRDLRLTDHAALDAAERSGLPLLYIWLLEPTEWTAPENSLRHWQFQWQSIVQINQLLEPFERKITVLYGEAKEAWMALMEQFTISQVWSYQETGQPRTYQRDLLVKELVRKLG